MKKLLFLLYLPVFLQFTLSGCVYNQKRLNLEILHVNDTHAHIEPVRISLKIGSDVVYAPVGGFPGLLTAIREERKKGEPTLFLSAGDVFQGTLYFNRYLGKADVKLLNMMQLDAMTLGNHEFDRGPEVLAEFVKEAAFPVVSANVDVSGDKSLQNLVKPYVIREMNGRKVGIIGLTTTDTSEISSPGPMVRFSDHAAAAKRCVRELQDMGINIIIVLSHLGYEVDRELAAAVPGIDVVIGGHTHTLLGDFSAVGLKSEGKYPAEVKNILGGSACVGQAWEWGKALGVMRVEFDSRGELLRCGGKASLIVGESLSRKQADGTYKPLDEPEKQRALSALGSNPNIRVSVEDAEALAVLAPYKKGVEDMYNSVVAEVTDDLLHVRAPGRHASGVDMPGGSYLSPVVAESVMRKFDGRALRPDMSLVNAGEARGDLLRGKLTVGGMFDILPFGNTIVLLRLNGAEIRSVLDAAVTRSMLPDKSGGFPYPGGARFSVDMGKPAGSRIVSLELKDEKGNWKGIEPDREYVLAVGSYLAGGGDGYEILKNSVRNRYDTGFKVIEAFTEYAFKLKVIRRLPDTGVKMVGR